MVNGKIINQVATRLPINSRRVINQAEETPRAKLPRATRTDNESVFHNNPGKRALHKLDHWPSDSCPLFSRTYKSGIDASNTTDVDNTLRVDKVFTT